MTVGGVSDTTLHKPDQPPDQSSADSNIISLVGVIINSQLICVCMKGGNEQRDAYDMIAK